MILPVTRPPMITVPALTSAWMTALSPMTRVPLVMTSPSTRPSIRTVPSYVMIPLNSVPLPRKAMISSGWSACLSRSSFLNMSRCLLLGLQPFALLNDHLQEAVQILRRIVIDHDPSAFGPRHDPDVGAEVMLQPFFLHADFPAFPVRFGRDSLDALRPPLGITNRESSFQDALRQGPLGLRIMEGQDP